MLHNLFIYLPFIAYLAIAGHVIWHRRNLGANAYRWFLGLTAPALLLILAGFTAGIRQMPPHKVTIHGYRVPLSSNRQAFTIGSDVGGDDVRFHYRFKDREQFAAGLAEVSFAGTRGSIACYLTQLNARTPNVITIDGLPLRAQRLVPERVQRISFAATGYSDEDDKVLLLRIHGGIPVFSFQGRDFRAGFSKSMLWGLIRLPYGDNIPRHLAFGRRLLLPGLPGSARELLGQAAILRHGGHWWLAANDAQIHLDGAEFPNAIGLEAGSTVRLFTRQLDEGRHSVAFRLAPPDEDGRASLQLLDADKSETPLPRHLEASRLCLTGNESYYSDTIDIRDPQFPPGGTLINKEGSGFVFRGRLLVKDQLYLCGKAVFSIDQVDEPRLRAVAWLALLFLLSISFIPPAMVRKEPLGGVVLSAAMFLLAFRQLLAFRAWQGPPFKETILMDSLIAPLIFMLTVLVIAARYGTIGIVRHYFARLRNFFFPGSRAFVPQAGSASGGLALLGLALFGFAIYLAFGHYTGMVPAVLILVALVASPLFNLLGPLEELASYYSAAGTGTARFKPAIVLLPVLLGLLLLGPVLGGREVIAILPGRPRPDIFIQLFLLFVVAYFASLWEKSAARGAPHPMYILGTFAFALVLPFLQGAFAGDMGFFVMVCLPLLLILIGATWKLDARIRVFLIACLALVLLAPFLFNLVHPPLESVSMRRIAFFMNKERIRTEYFFDYLAHLPILWSSSQGLFGGGFFNGHWYSALAETSINDNVASVFIQGELGVAGSLLTIAVFAVMVAAIMVFLADQRHRRGDYRRWFLFGIGCMLMWTAGTMFLANLGFFPLTGKNLPFLGIDSLNDVVRYGLLCGFALRYMNLVKES